MKGYIGVTAHVWWDYLKDKNIDVINFWNKKKAFKVLDTGDYFFFLKKNGPKENGERYVVGYAEFDDFEYIDLDEAWDKYQQGNGHPDKEDFVKSMGSTLGDSQLTQIGCILLRRYKKFKTPVLLSEVGIEFANSIVSGKSIDEIECRTLLEAGEKSVSDDINSLLEPDMIEERNGTIKVTCAKCKNIFEKASRCPECGQLIKY